MSARFLFFTLPAGCLLGLFIGIGAVVAGNPPDTPPPVGLFDEASPPPKTAPATKPAKPETTTTVKPQPAVPVVSAEPAVETEEDPIVEELKLFDFDIEVQALQELNQQFSKRKFAQELKIKRAIYPPALPADIVEIKIETRINEILGKKFPNSHYAEIRREAEEKYKLYPLKSVVTIEANSRGKKATFTGVLDFVTPEWVKVQAPIAKRDVLEQYLPHLYRAEHEIAVKHYISKATRDYNMKKSIYETKLRKKISAYYWATYGYMRRKKQWVPKIDIFNALYEKAYTQRLDKIREEVRRKVYTENGYAYNDKLAKWEKAAPVVAEPEVKESILDQMQGFLQDTVNKAIGGATQKDQDAPPEDKKTAPEPTPDGGLGPKEQPTPKTAPPIPAASMPAPPKAGTAPTAPPARGDVSDLFDEDD